MNHGISPIFRLFAYPTLLIVLLFGCKQDEPLDGFDLLTNPSDRGSVDSTSIVTLAVEETFTDTLSRTGTGLFLELGQFDGLQTHTLLKFESIPDTVTINEATLLLNTNTIYAEGRQKSSFDATVHQARIGWNENEVLRFDDFVNGYDPTPIAGAKILSTAADLSGTDSLFIETVRFEFNSAGVNLVRTWADTNRMDNFGILIKFDNSMFIKEFLSQNGSLNQPRLELGVTNGNGVRDTLFSVANEDAFILERVAPLPSGPLYVDNVFSHQTVLKFDIADIPRESTINQAVLNLNVMQDNSNIKNSGFTILINSLEQEFQPPDVIEVDPQGFATTASVGPTTRNVEIPITSLLQFWLTEDIDNRGIILRTASPGQDITRVALESTATNSELAPRIDVQFSVAPNN